MWALIDCNSYFASVERAFHPGLDGRPVVVLSANDGIIVALTPEAKSLGLHRGDALFQVREIVERNRIALFSTNMTLYAAMSRRILGIIRQAVDRVENYSIDESFAYLGGYDGRYDLVEYMRGLADRIRLWTGVPISVGIAPTKTLAKIASKFAKKYPGYRSVCMIDSDGKRRKALSLTELSNVWGLGSRSCEKLRSLGVQAPLEFADRPAEWVRSHFFKPVIQTWQELNGWPCILTEEVLQRQNITVSRCFGDMISTLDDLKASVATFAAGCANKLRGQRSVAGAVTVFLCSNAFRPDLEQYSNMATRPFRMPTADTVEITATVLALTESLYKSGICYKRSGVILSHISSDTCVQQVLFDPIQNRPERLGLSRTLDTLNQRLGPKTVRLAIEGTERQPWNPRSAHRSGDYLTDLGGILTVGG